MRTLLLGVRLHIAEEASRIAELDILSPLYPRHGLRKGLFLNQLDVAGFSHGRGEWAGA